MLFVGDRLAKVDLVQKLLLVIKLREVGSPVPACEGVALAGGRSRLAHDAVGVGYALLEFLTICKQTTICNVHNIASLLLLFVLGPCRVHRGVGLVDRLAKVNLPVIPLIFRQLGKVGSPVPACEGVTLTGGRRRLAKHAVRISNALHGVVAVNERAAISYIENVKLSLLCVLFPESKEVCVALKRIREVNLLGFKLIRSHAFFARYPIPTLEGVAITGGRCRLAYNAIGVSLSGQGLGAISKSTAISYKLSLKSFALCWSFAFS